MASEPDITSVQNPRVKALVKLADHRARRQVGLFIAEGMRAVSRAIAAGLDVQSLWVCEKLLDRAGLIREFTLLRPGFAEVENVVTVSSAVFRKVAYLREPEGVLAVCHPPTWSIDELPALDNNTFDLVAVGTEKPGNLGAMVRTAELAGCRSVWSAGTPVDTMNPNAIRASTGAVFTLPTVAVSEEQAIESLVAQGVRVIAAVVDGAVDHTESSYAGPCAIAIGPEDRGLSERWREAAQATGGALVKIAMARRSADSLNASVAAGVLLFEAVRQRRVSELQ